MSWRTWKRWRAGRQAGRGAADLEGEGERPGRGWSPSAWSLRHVMDGLGGVRRCARRPRQINPLFTAAGRRDGETRRCRRLPVRRGGGCWLDWTGLDWTDGLLPLTRSGRTARHTAQPSSWSERPPCSVGAGGGWISVCCCVSCPIGAVQKLKPSSSARRG